MLYETPQRMPTYLWVEAEVRRILSEGFPVYIPVRGDKMGGTVIQKISNLSGDCKLIGQQRDLLGNLVWINLLQDDVVPETEADKYICRAVKRDPDVWVVEIEDKTMSCKVNYCNA